MKKLLLVLGLLFAVAAPLNAAPAPAKPDSYKSDELAAAASDYEQEIHKRVVYQPNDLRRPQRAAQAEQEGGILARGKRWSAAADAYATAIANDSQNPQIWLHLAEAQAASSQDRAQVSAYLAYKNATDPQDKAAALRIIGREYDRHDSRRRR